MRPQVQRRRRLAVTGLTGALALLLGACGAGRVTARAPSVRVNGGSAVATASPSTTSPSTAGQSKNGAQVAEGVGTCPGATQPPGSPYTLTISGTITGRLTITRNDSNSPHPATIPKISARFCGTLNVSNETGVVEPSNISFAPARIEMDYHLNKHGKPTSPYIIPVKFVPVGPATATVVKTGAANGAAPDGGLELTLSSQVDTIAFPDPGVRSVHCLDGPVTLDLSTEAPGGSPLVGPLQDAATTVAESGFTIPAMALGQPTCQDATIDFGLITNQLLYLPATDTATTETLTAHVAG